LKAMRSFSENAPSDKTIQRVNTCYFCTEVVLQQLAQHFFQTKNDIDIEGYFIVDMILSCHYPKRMLGI